jgi:hypothetical protein
MPILEITPDHLIPQRARLTVAYIESVMLWPGDSAARVQAFQAASVAAARERIKRAPATAIACFTLGQLAGLMDAVESAPRLAEVRTASGRPIVHGLVTGSVFCVYWAAGTLGIRARN